MFGKKIKCICGRKIDKKYEFCPHCGTSTRQTIEHEKNLKDRSELLDKEVDKITKELSESFGMPAIASFPFKLFIKKLSKDIDKQFREMDQEMSRVKQVQENSKKNTRAIMQDGKKVGEIEEFQFPQGQGFSFQVHIGGMPQDLSNENLEDKEQEKKLKLPKSKITEEDVKKYSKLPRHDPATKVRRLTDKIVYEISLPGVKNEKNIILNKLQNSIEIKAFSKDKAYFKLIPLSLAIKSWKLEDQVLILELKAWLNKFLNSNYNPDY